MTRITDEESLSHENRRGWHLDKSVNLPFLLSLLLAGMGAMAYVLNQDQRQTRSEVEIQTLKSVDITHALELKELKSDLKSDLGRIESKLDRVIEKKIR